MTSPRWEGRKNPPHANPNVMARIFITGSVDGLGRAAAGSLIEAGHQVVVHARNEQRAETLGDLAHAGVVTGDLQSAAEVRSVADQVNAIGRMNAVIHNAGIYSESRRGSTPDGHSTILAVNTLAPYLLTALMERPDRLIYLSSGLHTGSSGPLRDLDWRTRRWDSHRAYAESKLHVTALAIALARRWPEVLCHAVDPGWVRTRMGGSSAPVDIATGQRTQSWLAVSDDPAALTSGRYWHDLKPQTPAPEASDESYQDKLLQHLEKLTGVALPDSAT